MGGDESPLGQRAPIYKHPAIAIGALVIGALGAWLALDSFESGGDRAVTTTGTMAVTTTAAAPTSTTPTSQPSTSTTLVELPPVTRIEVQPRADLSQCLTIRSGEGPLGCHLILLARGQSNLGDGRPADEASLRRPWGVEVGPDGAVYISDLDNNRIRVVTADGLIDTVAGSGAGQVRGTGDGLVATEANLRFPRNVAFGPDGRMYIADSNHYQIRVVGEDGVISTVAGSRDFRYSGDGGPALNAGISFPMDVAVGSDGTVYLIDASPETGRVRVVTPDGIIRTLVNTGDDRPFNLVVDRDRQRLYFSLRDGAVQAVDLVTGAVTSIPVQGGVVPLALDSDGNLHVGGAEAIAIFDPDTEQTRHLSLPSTLQRRTPSGIAVGDDGTVFLAVSETNVVWQLWDGELLPFAGSNRAPTVPVPLAQAPIPESQGLAYDAFGNLYWADFNYHQIMRLSTDGFVTTVAGTGEGRSSGDGGHPLDADFNHPRRLVFDSAGNLLFLDAFEGTASVRMISPGGDGVIDASPDERIATVAGRAVHRDRADHGGADGGPATSAVFVAARGFAVASDGRLLISDFLDHRIRMVTPGSDGIVNGGSDEIITTIAGTGEQSSTGDGGPASEASVHIPVWIEVDSEDNIYFYEDERRVIRRIDADTGVVTTFTDTLGDLVFSFAFDVDDALVYTTSTEIIRVDPATGEHEVMTGAGQSGLTEDDARSVTLDGVAAFAFDQMDTFAFIENSTNSLYLLAPVPLANR